MRGVTVVTLVLLVAVSYGLYRLKYRVEELRNRADAISAQIDDDKRAIKVLHAEWAYLTRPQRLQKLSEDFLKLQPLKASQIGELDEIPTKTAEGVEPAPKGDGAEVSQAAP